jgi:FtsP/CotA-like multicopper oxidase with cupredoxin domain
MGYICKAGSCCSEFGYCGTGPEFCNSSSPFKPEHPTGTASDKPSVSARQISGLKCPAANGTVYTTGSGAEYKVECGIDHVGGDIYWPGNGFIVDTLQTCIDECARWPDCKAVAWVDQYRPGGPCYIKDKIGKSTGAAHVRGAVLVKPCEEGCPTEKPDLNAPPYGTPHPTTVTVISSTSASSKSTTAQETPVTTTSPVSVSSIKTITPTTIASSANPSASSLASASASATACEHSFPKRSDTSPVFKREVIDPDCIPCEGQDGSLPYCGADVTTDNYQFTPKTCRTVYYNFDITNTTLAPDGIPRIVLTVNGSLPGPLLEANWGDTVVVTVNNKLQDNGTSIHFHGIRQLNNSEYDGVPAITQCPIAPGDSMTYRWVATNYGTSWYHSHYAIQAWEGVFGPMVIHGPTSKEYDEDAIIFLGDWSHNTVDSQYDMEQDAKEGGPRTMDNGLINGKNTWGMQGTANQTGERYELPFKFDPGKTYLLRIINGAIQSSYKFYIDEHELEVIGMDFTNIVPYKTDVLGIQIGQRYNVLVKAKQTKGNYWMRADNQNACSTTVQALDIKGVIRYEEGDPTAMPTSTAHNYTAQCVDEPLASLIPMAPLNAFKSDQSFTKDITVKPNEENLFKWYLSGTTFYSKYEDPTLVRVISNNTAPTYSGNLILDLPKMGEWIYIVIESAIPVNHPIHLHGHDFLVLGSGSGTYTDQPLNMINPPRRDTANMPAAGWLVLGFETDNPGAWLMHCHIGWHTSMGFALQILEGQSMIRDTVKDECALYGTCAKWNKWVAERGFKQHDSGV